jgi:hypothetical protein
MLALLKKLVAEDGAQDLAEYGIALAVISAAAGAAALVIAGDVTTLWTKAQAIIDAAANG